MRNTPIVITAVAGAVVAALGVWAYRPAGPAGRVTRSVITLPAGIAFSQTPAQFAVSPDGQQIAMNLRSAEGARVWVWRLDGVDSRPLTGTEGVTSLPAWSPDSLSVAFVSGGKLRHMPVAGGPVETICELGPEATFDWGVDGTILLAAGGQEPIRRVAAAAGDTIRQITRVYPDEQHEVPKFVAGARRFLFYVGADALREGVWAGSFDGGKARRLLPHATAAVVAGAFIVYTLDGLVVAQRFNGETLEITGVPVTLADHVQLAEASGRPAYSVSAAPHALLAFQSATDGSLHLVNGWPALVGGQ
jgi:hypothetical protein